MLINDTRELIGDCWGRYATDCERYFVTVFRGDREKIDGALSDLAESVMVAADTRQFELWTSRAHWLQLCRDIAQRWAKGDVELASQCAAPQLDGKRQSAAHLGDSVDELYVDLDRVVESAENVNRVVDTVLDTLESVSIGCAPWIGETLAALKMYPDATTRDRAEFVGINDSTLWHRRNKLESLLTIAALADV